MKTVTTSIRTHEGNTNGNKYKLPTIIQPLVYNSISYEYEFNSVYEFIEMFTPVKQTKGIMSAIKREFEANGQVTYNIGNGNQTFYFNAKSLESIKTNVELYKLTNNETPTEFTLNNKSVFVLGSLKSGFGIWEDANCENFIKDIDLGIHTFDTFEQLIHA